MKNKVPQKKVWKIKKTTLSWKCTPLLRTEFFGYTQIWHSWKRTPSEEKSAYAKSSILYCQKNVILTTGDAYVLYYLIEKYID